MSKVQVQAAPPDGAKERDWAELHRDVLTVIFYKVGMPEVLLRTSKVCSPWRKAARDEPLLWRKIDMRMNYSDDCPMYEEFKHLGAMVTFDKARANLTKVAVNWGGNSVEELTIRDCYDDNLFEYIAERELVRLKQLEELEIVRCSARPGLLRTIETECPKLKRLKLKSVQISPGLCIVQEEFGIPETML